MNTRSVITVVAAGVAVFAVAVTVLAMGFIAAIGGPLVGGGCGGDGGIGGGSQQIGPRSWSAEQTANAQTITAVAISRGLPRRAAVLANSTAIVESELRNLPYGDRDSIGLFQQRPSQGWGAVADLLNPTYAAGKFYDNLLTVPNWATLPPGVAAQAVQRSGFPERYGPQEAAAADLVALFWVGPDNPVPLPAAAHPANPSGGVGGTPPVGSSIGMPALLGCPDQGGSNIPLSPSTLDPRKLPPGFTLPADPKQRAAVSYALAQLGKPYVWGAEGPDGFDCSGLMQAAYAAAGVPISRVTTAQAHDGTPVNGIANLTAGDLLLIPGAEGTAAAPGHVGMYAGDGIIVDAYDTSRGVILQKLSDWQGKIVAIRHITGPTRPDQGGGPNPASANPASTSLGLGAR